MAEGSIALLCMGFLAGTVIGIFVFGIHALLKNEKE